MVSRQQELSETLELVGYRAPQHEVLVAANLVMSLENYLAIVASEVQELAEQYDEWKKKNDKEHKKTPLPKNFFMELFDVIVTLGNARQRIMPNFSLEAADLRVDGQFHGSFDSLEKQVWSLGEGDIERNLKLVFTELLSLLKHLDIGLQAETYVKLTNRKLEGNKESRFYLREPGMSEAEMLLKYDHVTKALRIIRKFLRQTTGSEITLQPWMTDPFVKTILDWRSSQAALARLPQELLLFHGEIKDQVVWKLTPRKWDEVGMSKAGLLLKADRVGDDLKLVSNDQNIQLKMMLAGAKLISPPERPKAATLQGEGSNATLGPTILWV